MKWKCVYGDLMIISFSLMKMIKIVREQVANIGSFRWLTHKSDFLLAPETPPQVAGHDDGMYQSLRSWQ